MKLRPWHRDHSTDGQATAAIHEARSRARESESLMEQEAVMAGKLRQQRMTNGFAEMIVAVISQSGKGNQ